MGPEETEEDAGTQTVEFPDALQERLESLYARKPFDVIAPYIQPDLFHYTTIEGLRGIIESNMLHASSAYHLNDSSEIEYGCQLVVDATGKWLQVNSGKQSLGLKMLEVINATFTSEPSRIGRYFGIYVVCFCENGNLLSQWRAYGQTGGYAIGMLSSALEVGLLAPGFFDTRLLKVIYDPQEQEQIIHSVITAYLEEIENKDLYTIRPDPRQKMRFQSRLGLFLQELLLEQVVRFKNPAFAEEREWRIVARPRLIDILHLKREEKSSENEDPLAPPMCIAP
jgi:hypothetical protein